MTKAAANVPEDELTGILREELKNANDGLDEVLASLSALAGLLTLLLNTQADTRKYCEDEGHLGQIVETYKVLYKYRDRIRKGIAQGAESEQQADSIYESLSEMFQFELFERVEKLVHMSGGDFDKADINVSKAKLSEEDFEAFVKSLDEDS